MLGMLGTDGVNDNMRKEMCQSSRSSPEIPLWKIVSEGVRADEGQTF